MKNFVEIKTQERKFNKREQPKIFKLVQLSEKEL